MYKPMFKIIACSHPKGIIPTCRCGANTACPDCGYGQGASPCACSREDAKVTTAAKKYSEMFSEAWKELA